MGRPKKHHGETRTITAAVSGELLDRLPDLRRTHGSMSEAIRRGLRKLDGDELVETLQATVDEQADTIEDLRAKLDRLEQHNQTLRSNQEKKIERQTQANRMSMPEREHECVECGHKHVDAEGAKRCAEWDRKHAPVEREAAQEVA